MRDGELIITTREATDHLSLDGRIVAWRSRDGGRTWGTKEPWLNVPRADHRSSPVIELTNGEWLLSDYRAGHLYNAEGVFDEGYTSGPTLWSAWSNDRGRTWTFSKDPILVPGADPYGEAERHMIELPGGRILMAANFVDKIGTKPDHYSVAVHASDDRGRTWRVIGRVPENPLIIGEPTFVRTRSGRIVMIMRTQHKSGAPFAPRGPLLQSVSTDEGVTWSAAEPTGMSSMASPGHLLILRDGRLLCTHASRHHPGSVYVTVSRDEGRTWDTHATKIVTNDMPGDDSCYPTSAQLEDGTIVTTWYMNLFGRFAIMLARYGVKDLG
jgi:hypothetical protein